MRSASNSISKSGIRGVLVHKFDWILQKGHHHTKTKLLVDINTTLKYPCLVWEWGLSHSPTWYRPRYAHTLMPKWGNQNYYIETAILTLLPVKVGLLSILFSCYSHVESQWGHQTWPRVKKKPVHKKCNKNFWSKYTTGGPCWRDKLTIVFFVLQGPLSKDSVIQRKKNNQVTLAATSTQLN